MKVKYDAQSQEWKVLEEGSKEEGSMYIDGYLKANLDLARKYVKQEWDMPFICDGYEGGGKSTFTQQAAHYCDPTFKGDEGLEREVFTPSQFEEALNHAEPYQAIVYDEAASGFDSRAAMSNINKVLRTKLSRLRRKKLFIFVVMYSFFDMDKTIALWRTRGLFNVYDDQFERGFFNFWNREGKKILYVLGKETYNYTKPHPDFYGRFTNHWVLDKKAYDKKKEDSEEDMAKLYDKKVSSNAQTILAQLRERMVINMMRLPIPPSSAQMAEILEVTPERIGDYKRDLKEKEGSGSVFGPIKGRKISPQT